MSYTPRVGVRTAFLDTARLVRSLMGQPEVAASWDRPSALAEMDVASLTGHLARSVTSTLTYLNRPEPTEGRPVDAAGYYLGIEGLDGPIDSSLHQAIRARGAEEAAGGLRTLLSRWDDAFAELQTRLAEEPADRLIEALRGAVLRLDDYLVTRLVEMVIHADDLAVSVGVEHPPFSPEATDLVIGCLLEMVRRRRDDIEVIRGLARRERASGEALKAF